MTKQGFKCTCLLKLEFGIKIRYHVRYKSSQGSRICCESKKKNKEKNAKQYYRYNDRTYVQLSSNYEKAIQNANESEFLHWNIPLSKSKPKSFYHGKTELEKRQFYLYFEIIMERKKRSDGLSLKCKIIFRLSTCLLNSPSLNGSSPRLVYSRRNSGKCTGPR